MMNSTEKSLCLVDKHGTSLPLRGHRIEIGRSSDKGIKIRDAQVSRHHATIFSQGGQLYVQDEQSQNGTWLNGERISRAAPLKVGDRIKIGRTEFVLKDTEPGRRSEYPASREGRYAKPSTQASVLPLATFGVIAVLVLCIALVAVVASSQSQVTPTTVALGIPTITASPVLTGLPGTLTPRSDSASKMISAALGGSVQLADGTRVDISPGALATDTEISISVPKTSPDLGGLQAMVFREFGPSGIKFQKPVRITLPFGALDMSNATALDAVFVARWNGQHWEYVGGTPNAATHAITAEASTFSVFSPVPYTSISKLKDLRMRTKDNWANENFPKMQDLYDKDMTDLADRTHKERYVWRVYDSSRLGWKDYRNAGAAGIALINDYQRFGLIIVDLDFYLGLMPTRMLPKVKRNLVFGPVLGHEESHEINGDDLVLGAIELLGKDVKPWEVGKQIALYKIAQALNSNVPYPLLWKEVLATLSPLPVPGNTWCEGSRPNESRSDMEGVRWASDTAPGNNSTPGWIPKLGNETDENVRMQVILTTIHFFRQLPMGWVPECEHPASNKRADDIREMFLKDKDVGGLYGKVKATGTNPSGIRITEPISGRWVESDGEALYLLAPIPVGPQSLRLSKDGCDTQRFDVDTPDTDLKNQELPFVCIPPVTSTATPTATYTPMPPPTVTPRPPDTPTPPPTVTPRLPDTPTPPPTVTPRPPDTPTPQPPTPTPFISFWADHRNLNAGQCTTLHWDVENVSEVYLDGGSVTGHGTRQVCPAQTTPYRLRVVLRDRSVRQEEVTIVVTAPITVTPPALGYSSIINKRWTSLCLGVRDSSQADGVFIEQRSCSGGANQSWALQSMGGGYYQLVARHSGKCMTVQDAGQHEGALIVQWACTGAPHQLWRLVPVGGYYQIAAKHSGQCVDEDAFRRDEGLEMQQWPCGSNDIDNQLWSLGSYYGH